MAADDEIAQMLLEMKAGYIALAERHRKLQEMHMQLLAVVDVVVCGSDEESVKV
jgi:hypothetical protein